MAGANKPEGQATASALAPAPDTGVDVSVVVVCWNSAPHIGRCLCSLREQTRTLRLEILVVDNGSTDDTLARVRQAGAGIVLLEARGNLGFPRANNWAIRHAHGRYIMLLNPDTELANDALASLVTALAADPSAGAAGPRIFEPDGSESAFAVRAFPSLWGAFARHWGLHGLFPGVAAFHPDALPRLDRARPAAVPALSGAAMLLRRETFERLGLLDEQLPMYLEDLELCARLRAAGLSCIYVPEARITHWGGASAKLSPVALRLWALEQAEAPYRYFLLYRGRAAAVLFYFIIGAASDWRLLTMSTAWLLTAKRWQAAERVGRRAGTLVLWSGRRQRLLQTVMAAFSPPDYDPERAGTISITETPAP